MVKNPVIQIHRANTTNFYSAKVLLLNSTPKNSSRSISAHPGASFFSGVKARIRIRAELWSAAILLDGSSGCISSQLGTCPKILMITIPETGEGLEPINTLSKKPTTGDLRA